MRNFKTSLGAQAVMDALSVAMRSVQEKYPKRGDSWVEAFTASTCFNLAGAKIKRVELLLENNQMTEKEIIAEIQEESGDAIAYLAFGMCLVDIN